MLIAQLKGKLTFEEERTEDLLTSNVFGSFMYANPEKGLLLFLKEACTPERDSPFAGLPPVSSVHYEFWPQFDYSVNCEPDVIVHLTHQDQSLSIIMIECKYLSGKSSIPSQEGYLSDQLAREWDNLKDILMNEKAERGCLLYVTADYIMPCKEIEESQGELECKLGKKGYIAWVSWRVLPKLLEQSKTKILEDLRDLLLKQGLDVFRGIKLSMDYFKTINWSFVVPKRAFLWQFITININWSFQETASNLNVKHSYLDWRFKDERRK